MRFGLLSGAWYTSPALDTTNLLPPRVEDTLRAKTLEVATACPRKNEIVGAPTYFRYVTMRITHPTPLFCVCAGIIGLTGERLVSAGIVGLSGE